MEKPTINASSPPIRLTNSFSIENILSKPNRLPNGGFNVNFNNKPFDRAEIFDNNNDVKIKNNLDNINRCSNKISNNVGASEDLISDIDNNGYTTPGLSCIALEESQC